MKNAKRTKTFLKALLKMRLKKRRNSICNIFVLRSVLYDLLLSHIHFFA